MPAPIPLGCAFLSWPGLLLERIGTCAAESSKFSRKAGKYPSDTLKDSTGDHVD